MKVIFCVKAHDHGHPGQRRQTGAAKNLSLSDGPQGHVTASRMRNRSLRPAGREMPPSSLVLALFHGSLFKRASNRYTIIIDFVSEPLVGHTLFLMLK